MNIAEYAENLLLPAAEQENIEIVDIEYVTEDQQKVLRIFIDAQEGVNIDLCTKMSRLFGEKLDQDDKIKEHYILEISSPGIDRILKKEKDFNRFKGFRIKVNTVNAINGQRHFKGNLVAAGNSKIVIDDLTNKIVEIEISNIIKAQVDTEL